MKPTQDAMPTAVDCSMILSALYQKYDRKRNWLSFAELRVGTGYGKGVEQRIDFWTMHEWPSAGLIRKAFEIKVSRSDFLAEIKNPIKRRIALLVSNEFYFVAPVGMIRPDELPLEAGLIEYHLHGSQLYTKHEAPYRDAIPPTWRFLAAVTRRAWKEKSDEA